MEKTFFLTITTLPPAGPSAEDMDDQRGHRIDDGSGVQGGMANSNPYSVGLGAGGGGGGVQYPYGVRHGGLVSRGVVVPECFA